jgi:hypothetical protein
MGQKESEQSDTAVAKTWATRRDYLRDAQTRTGLQFNYYRPDRTLNSYHEGIICVGWVWDKITRQIKYSAAFCSPVDSFCREEGRWHIMMRFLKDFWVVIDCDNRPTRSEAALKIKEHYQEHTEDMRRFGPSLGLKGPIPRWAKSIPESVYTQGN